MELRIPSSVSSIDVATDGLLVAMGTERFARCQAHEILLALQAMHGTGEISFAFDALPVRGLLDALAERRATEGAKRTRAPATATKAMKKALSM